MFNLMKTAILMAAITALFMLVGRWLGGQAGMMLALVVALGMNFFSYWFSDKLVLKMYNAQEVDETSGAAVRAHGARAGRPGPDPDAQGLPDRRGSPNAFATGRSPTTPRWPPPPASSASRASASCAA